jgi:hypothetical protein
MSNFVTVTRRRRRGNDSNESTMMQDDDNDMQHLSTLLAGPSLCLSVQPQDVTSCSSSCVLPTTHGKEIYSGKLPTILSPDNKNDYHTLVADIGKLAMETFPFDEPAPVMLLPDLNAAADSVAGFPDFAWTENTPCSDWQERRRLESILAAAATPVMTKTGVQHASMRLQHQQSLRRLRKLRRKSVNLATRGSKRHRRLLEAMEVDGKDKYYHHSVIDHDNETTIEWERERSGTAKGAQRYQTQCRNRRKNHIHKVQKSVRGWRHDFHKRRFELTKGGGAADGHDDNTFVSSNTSRLGQEDHAKRQRQQRALNDLQREMSYLGL